jgi:hypothetical protein
MIDEGDCGAIGGMKTGRGKRSTRRNPAPGPLCPPVIPHDQTWARTRAVAVGSRQLTASTMALPNLERYRYTCVAGKNMWNIPQIVIASCSLVYRITSRFVGTEAPGTAN